MATSRLVTAEELEAMGSDAWFELYAGVLHETFPSYFYTAVVLTELSRALYKYVERHRLGLVLAGDPGFILERNPDTVVAPKIAFVRAERCPPIEDIPGFFPGAPDLIVEADSLPTTPEDIRRKKELYELIEIPLVWWIEPENRTASIHAPGRSVQHLTMSDSLDGESVVSGFTLPLASLFDF